MLANTPKRRTIIQGSWGYSDIKTRVFGGSYLGLKKIHPNPDSMTNGYSDNMLSIERYSDLWNDAQVTTVPLQLDLDVL